MIHIADGSMQFLKEMRVNYMFFFFLRTSITGMTTEMKVLMQRSPPYLQSFEVYEVVFLKSLYLPHLIAAIYLFEHVHK